MSWGNLEQLSRYGNTKNSEDGLGNTKDSGIGIKNEGGKSNEAQKTVNTKVVGTLEGHISMASFFQGETNLNNSGRNEFWGNMLVKHKDWFTSHYPMRARKVWLLKIEYSLEIQPELEEYVAKYNSKKEPCNRTNSY